MLITMVNGGKKGDDDGDNINDDDNDGFKTFYFTLIYFKFIQFIAVYMKHK